MSKIPLRRCNRLSLLPRPSHLTMRCIRRGSPSNLWSTPMPQRSIPVPLDISPPLVVVRRCCPLDPKPGDRRWNSDLPPSWLHPLIPMTKSLCPNHTTQNTLIPSPHTPPTAAMLMSVGLQAMTLSFNISSITIPINSRVPSLPRQTGTTSSLRVSPCWSKLVKGAVYPNVCGPGSRALVLPGSQSVLVLRLPTHRVSPLNCRVRLPRQPHTRLLSVRLPMSIMHPQHSITARPVTTAGIHPVSLLALLEASVNPPRPPLSDRLVRLRLVHHPVHSPERLTATPTLSRACTTNGPPSRKVQIPRLSSRRRCARYGRIPVCASMVPAVRCVLSHLRSSLTPTDWSH